MFTGIITEIGEVRSVSRKGADSVLRVSCNRTREDLTIGDSVAVNGVCLSVVDNKDPLEFDVVANTFKKTNLKRLKAGSKVNLENALKAGDSLSGHMVTGHIDCERPIKSLSKTKDGWVLDVALSPQDDQHLVPRGSIAVDGVSLTVGELRKDQVRIFLIPHTIDNTILKLKTRGDYVNLEFDIMAKYAQKNLTENSITEKMLREKGFI
ncbi:MAG: riboflavin synthase [Candidatus Omnitrophica bacterium]|nr:riboflavin synthase [Candidatus Omnitrophota bacterium]